MKKIRKILYGAIFAWVISGSAKAAVWQWSVPVKSEKPENGFSLFGFKL